MTKSGHSETQVTNGRRGKFCCQEVVYKGAPNHVEWQEAGLCVSLYNSRMHCQKQVNVPTMYVLPCTMYVNEKALGSSAALESLYSFGERWARAERDKPFG